MVTYPDNTAHTVECTLSGKVYVGTVQGSTRTGNTSNGYVVFADGVDENGQAVTGYQLGKGDVVIMESDGRYVLGGQVYYFHWFDEVPTNPKKGDVARVNGYISVYDGTAWVQLQSEGTLDYNRLGNKPTLNGVQVVGVKTSADYGILTDEDVDEKLEPVEAELANKRDMDDMRVLGTVMKWVCEPPLPEGMTIGHWSKYDPAWCPVDEYGSQIGMSQGGEYSTELYWGEYDWVGGYPFTARRIQVIEPVDELAKASVVPTKVSDLPNDATYVKQSVADIKRDKNDLVVYDVNPDCWECDPELPNGYWIGRSEYDDGWCPYNDDGWQTGASFGNADSTELSWEMYDWSGGYPFTAKRVPKPIPLEDTIATVSYVDEKIGDIESALQEV